MRTSNWQALSIRTGTLREQSRRESNGTKHRETTSINMEIAGDCGPNPRSNTPSIDIARINAQTKATNKRIMHSDIMMRFGPRLVKSDGTARYTFQCKRK
jgi:hypothetical protein